MFFVKEYICRIKLQAHPTVYRKVPVVCCQQIQTIFLSGVFQPFYEAVQKVYVPLHKTAKVLRIQ